MTREKNHNFDMIISEQVEWKFALRNIAFTGSVYSIKTISPIIHPQRSTLAYQ